MVYQSKVRRLKVADILLVAKPPAFGLQYLIFVAQANIIVMKKWLPLLVLPLLLAACKKDDGRNQAEIDEEIIVNYIADNTLDATATGSGLYVVIDEPGTGQQPTSTSEVTVAYRGYRTDGQTFDESPASGATFSLTQVIEGWQEGIPHFKEGGSGILLIPSALGYGARGAGSSIPPNTVLVFDVELIDVP